MFLCTSRKFQVFEKGREFWPNWQTGITKINIYLICGPVVLLNVFLERVCDVVGGDITTACSRRQRWCNTVVSDCGPRENWTGCMLVGLMSHVYKLQITYNMFFNYFFLN